MKIIIFLILIFYSLPAYAYIDPGTGSTILQFLFAIIAAVGSGFFFLRSKILSFFDKSKKIEQKEMSINTHKQQVSNQNTNFKVSWDYTIHAQHYDKRADYSQEALDKLIGTMGCAPFKPVADIGAGTGKLTKELLARGLTVKSVEPNDAMRSFGIENTSGKAVVWSSGTGESTGLQTSSVYGAFFGSSFNVVDQTKALNEVCRILVPNGWLVCMWNHRDLDDPIQKNIEGIIKSHISEYSYGLRREDPTSVIDSSKWFSEVKNIDGRFCLDMCREDIIIAWKSHATLRRQAGSDSVFDSIINKINLYLANLKDPISVPYTTRIYYAQKVKKKSALNAALCNMVG